MSAATTLSLPTITLTMFTILPLIFMILLAFTNYNREYSPPNKLFAWVGLGTFKKLFSTKAQVLKLPSVVRCLSLKMDLYGRFCDFYNFIFGMIAMIINRKSIRLKNCVNSLCCFNCGSPIRYFAFNESITSKIWTPK